MHLDSQLRYVRVEKKFQRIWIPDDVSFWTNIEKPLTCSITPVYLELFVGGKVPFVPPLPYLWSSAHHAVHAAFSGTDEPNSFYR